MKYKVGDKVRIVNERVKGMNSDGKMDCWLGKVMTINEVIEDYKRCPYKMKEDERYWSWSNDMIAGLAEPELTAEEVLRIMKELPFDFIHDFLGCCQGRTREEMLYKIATPQQVIDMCQQWKAEHEKKEPEVEWFWQGRIFKVNEDGCYLQIKDGTGFYDTGCEYRESAEEYMNDELKEYCKTHEGNYIAKIEHVCRVKAVS